MLGSVVQNVVVFSDSVFLYYLSEEDFVFIGFVGVFYLVIVVIGYGFLWGGQIMIVCWVGEGILEEVGWMFYFMVYFELVLVVVMFFIMQYGCYYFFGLFVNLEVVFMKSLEYLDICFWGVFFSYIGVVVIVLYIGVARIIFIIVDIIILGIVNIVFNYGLIFGYWGLLVMGIVGAGLVSIIVEIVVFVVFMVYIFFDWEVYCYWLFKLFNVDLEFIKQQYKLALLIVVQFFVGLGSWFVFFGIVENLGECELAIMNLVCMVYFILFIFIWGFVSGVNMLVSNFIGQCKWQVVVLIIWKIVKICWLIMMVLIFLVVFYLYELLYLFLGGVDMLLIIEVQLVFYVLVGIFIVFSIGSVYFNGLVGMGVIFFGLII